MPVTGARDDPYMSFNFIVEVDGVIVGGFAECGGLVTETDIVEYRNGDEDITVRKLPGKAKYTNITLKRGYTDSRELWEWRRQVITGQTQRKSGTIQLLNEARQQALKWNFREGWPSKWEGPAFNAKNNEVAIESLEIAHEGLELE
jgi:phage tail-like protein